jgi:hypothetical protein
MRDIQLFLRLLSERVYAANLRDASDFHEWLFKSSLLAGQSTDNSVFATLENGGDITDSQ